MLSPTQQSQVAPPRAIDSVTPAVGRHAAEQFVDSLIAEALDHRAINHPYLHALSGGTLPDDQQALTDFARIYYGYTAHFPRYLTAAISRLHDPAHRKALVENLTEESGRYHEQELQQLEAAGILREWIDGVPHPELFRRFREALGVPDDDDLDDIEVVCWREMFYSTIAYGSPSEAVGALGLGTETVVSAIYAHIVEALRRLPLTPESIVFFPLHCTVDDAHHETLKQIAIDYAQTEEGRCGLRMGMRKALSLRAGFWDHLLERARIGEIRKAA